MYRTHFHFCPIMYSFTPELSEAYAGNDTDNKITLLMSQRR